MGLFAFNRMRLRKAEEAKKAEEVNEEASEEVVQAVAIQEEAAENGTEVAEVVQEIVDEANEEPVAKRGSSRSKK